MVGFVDLGSRLQGITYGALWTIAAGSWVVISGAIRPLIQVMTVAILLFSLLLTTHEPPSRISGALWVTRLSCLSRLPTYSQESSASAEQKE